MYREACSSSIPTSRHTSSATAFLSIRPTPEAHRESSEALPRDATRFTRVHGILCARKVGRVGESTWINSVNPQSVRWAACHRAKGAAAHSHRYAGNGRPARFAALTASRLAGLFFWREALFFSRATKRVQDSWGLVQLSAALRAARAIRSGRLATLCSDAQFHNRISKQSD